MYKYEFHAHCQECSKCARSAAVDMVKAFHEAGYAGMVFTDHCCCGFSSVPEEWGWERRVRWYYDVYLEAKKAGDALDFDVHFGWEHYVGRGKEILTYGIDVEFLLENPDIPSLTPEEYCERVHRVGGYTVQAHPYRRREDIDATWPAFVHCVDGMEVYNAANGPLQNSKAMLLALAHPELGRLSGGDCHHVVDSIGKAGLAFDHRLRTKEELVQALQSGEGHLICEGSVCDTVDEFLAVSPLI